MLSYKNWKTGIFLGVVFTLALSAQIAAAGDGGFGAGNGGDMCELRIQVIRNDIEGWILQGGPKNLKISPNLSVERYSAGMREQFKKAVVNCTNERLFVGSAEKTCKNHATEIVCNIDRFMKQTTEPDQYVLIHHEYAGLAGFEVNSGEASDYTVSSQLTGFLNRTVKMLSIAPVTQPLTRTSISGHTFTQVTDRPELGNAWKDESGLIWGDLVVYNNEETRFMTRQDATAYCNSIGARLPTKDQFSQLAKYLGNGSNNGYYPEILPNLIGNSFWSASVSPDRSDSAYRFYGSYGELVGDFRHYHNSVRCVGR